MKQYDIIYADPAWPYDNEKTGGSMKSGAAQKYPTMSLDEICALPLRQLTHRASACFLWATVPMLPEAMMVLAAWGFKYKTAIVWHKVGRRGLGHWYRGEVELLLLGVRGPLRAFRMQESNHVEAPVLRHSEKPDVFRQKVERAADRNSLPARLELFARVHPTGWDVWGNDIPGSIDLNQYTPKMPPPCNGTPTSTTRP